MQNFSLRESWINSFRSLVTQSMRNDVSSHAIHDENFIRLGGPEKVIELMCSGDIFQENFASILINSMIPYHCPHTNKVICADERCMTALAALISDHGRRPIGYGLPWETRSTTINNLSFCAKYEENHNILNKLDIKEVIVTETKVIEKSVATISATIFLANLVGNREDKDSSNLISSQYNLDNLVHALEVKEWLNWMWPPRTMAPPLRRLALNESNKTILREVGILTVISDNLENREFLNDIITVHEILLLILNLVFDDLNKAEMNVLGYKAILIRISKNMNTLNQSCLLTIKQILWKLDPPLEVNPPSMEQSNSTAGRPKQVMISYNWSVQPIAIAISTFLQEKSINVWIDIEKMEGSTLEAMANAVESSDVILVLISRKYKESPNCRLEGEYAFQKRKDIIFIMAEAGYNADGWLGAILGTHLWFDFTTDYKLKPSCDDLYKTLQRKLSLDVPATKSLVVKKLQNDVKRGWTADDVGRWVDSILKDELHYSDGTLYGELFRTGHMNGSAMYQLAEYSRRDASFYRDLLEQLSFPLTPVGVFLQFTHNLETEFK